MTGGTLKISRCEQICAFNNLEISTGSMEVSGSIICNKVKASKMSFDYNELIVT